MELLVACGAQTTVRTATQQMTVLHVLFLLGKKSAEDTLQTAKLLLDHGLRELINEADSLGNTPLHALIVRYALEEAKYGYGFTGGYGDHRHEEPQPWNKWDMLHIVRYLIHQVKLIDSVNSETRRQVYNEVCGFLIGCRTEHQPVGQLGLGMCAASRARLGVSLRAARHAPAAWRQSERGRSRRLGPAHGLSRPPHQQGSLASFHSHDEGMKTKLTYPFLTKLT